jgi:hypothetical protein
MRLLFAQWPGGDHALLPLAETFAKMGRHHVSILSLGEEYQKTPKHLYKRIPHWNHSCNSEAELDDKLAALMPDIMFLWNGNLPNDEMVRRVAGRHGAVCIWAEMGWFPQKETVYFDPEGTNARSSIRRVNLDECEIDPRLEAFRRSYGGGVYGHHEIEGYIFAPLQIESDTNIREYSPFRTMDDFVARLSKAYSRTRILARPRPGRHTALSSYPNVVVNSADDLFEQIAGAIFVVGINSTVLLEALLLGKHVVAFGEGLFSGLGVCDEATAVAGRRLAGHVVYSADERHYDKERIDRFLSELVFRRQIRCADLESVDEVRNYYLFKEWA